MSSTDRPIRQLGTLEGQFTVPDDFDTMFQEEIEAMFYGEPAIRSARPDDIPALMRIRAAVKENRLTNPDRVPASAYTEFMAISTIWVWEHHQDIGGFAACDPRNGTIWALFVDPALEGRGIGRALMPPVLEDLRRAGWSNARLGTEADSRAEAFYRRQGWVPGEIDADGERRFTMPLT